MVDMITLVVVGVIAFALGAFAAGGYVYLSTRASVRRIAEVFARPDVVPPAVDTPCGYSRPVLAHWTCVLERGHGGEYHRNREGLRFVALAENDDSVLYEEDPDPNDFDPSPMPRDPREG